MISCYDWAGGREAMMRFGPADGPVVIVALPPFEEANRTRTFAVRLLRDLAARGIGGALPDLPGAGDSLVATEDATLAGWRAAFGAAARSVAATHSMAIRAGALIDRDVARRWHLSPQTGAQLLRELERMRIAAGGSHDDAPVIEIAGNRLSRTLLSELADAEPLSARVVRLERDRQPADRAFPAGPLWRRIEPDDDPVLAAALADDIAQWIATCAA